MEAWRRVIIDGFAVAPRPDGLGVWLQDLLAATEFRDRYRREQQVPLTYSPIFIKACALGLRKYPQCNALVGHGKIVSPSSIDIGISMAGEGVLDPVVVIREADTKSLKGIVAEIRERGRDRQEQQQGETQILNSLGRWVPSILRRKILAWTMRNAALQRRYVGTFQISVLASPGAPFEFILPMYRTTTLMMAVNAIIKRPIVVEDRLAIRPTAYITLSGDHGAVGIKDVIGFMNEVQHLLLNPAQLGE
jgi:2-oxoisovalerate dehydrogenase E2 component (dihydrolipoyl transacylase)